MAITAVAVSFASASACRELKACRRFAIKPGVVWCQATPTEPLSATSTRSLPSIFARYNASSAALNSPSTLWPLSGKTATPNDNEIAL